MSEYLIHLRPLASDIPEPVRLRGALKALKRRFALQCVEMTEADVCPLPAPRPPKRKSRKSALPETK